MIPIDVQVAVRCLIKGFVVPALLNVDWLNNGVDATGNKESIVRFLNAEQSNYLKYAEYVLSLNRTESAEEPRTTNLNFWEAYQAMKRGEWVGNVETGGVGEHHYELDDDGGMTLFTYDNEHTGCEFGRHHLDSTTWYIVPKGPRYKVGDRFSKSISGVNRVDVALREIVYIDEYTKTYVVKYEYNRESKGVELCTEEYLNTLHKIGN